MPKPEDAGLLSMLSVALKNEIDRYGLWDYTMKIPHSQYEPRPDQAAMPVLWLDVQLGRVRVVKNVRLVMRLRTWTYMPLVETVTVTEIIPSADPESTLPDWEVRFKPEDVRDVIMDELPTGEWDVAILLKPPGTLAYYPYRFDNNAEALEVFRSIRRWAGLR